MPPPGALPDGRPASSGEDSVRPNMLGTQIRQLLLEQILRGDYEPGERLVETRIARDLGVSQGSVREALRALEGLGFVESAPYRGTRVRTAVTEAELAEVHPVRGALEDLAAQTAVPKLAADPSPLWREVEAMRAAAANGNVREYAAHNTMFHRVIVAAAGNRALLTAWESLGVEARLLVTTVTTEIDIKKAAERHVPVVKAIEEGDVEKVSALLREHQDIYESLPHLGTPQRRRKSKKKNQS
jgi:DNA-binding GntR family transcriptional regulator